MKVHFLVITTIAYILTEAQEEVCGDFEYTCDEYISTCNAETGVGTLSITVCEPDLSDADEVKSTINVNIGDGVTVSHVVVSTTFQHENTNELWIRLGHGGPNPILVATGGSCPDNQHVNVKLDHDADMAPIINGNCDLSRGGTDCNVGGYRQPWDALSQFYGQNPNGDWTLTITDHVDWRNNPIFGKWKLELTVANCNEEICNEEHYDEICETDDECNVGDSNCMACCPGTGKCHTRDELQEAAHGIDENNMVNIETDANGVMRTVKQVKVRPDNNTYDWGYNYVIVSGVILFILINNIFICYWCVCKNGCKKMGYQNVKVQFNEE